MSSQTLHPAVEWAQRSSDSDAEKNFIYLKIEAADVPNDQMSLDLQPTGLTFKGYSNSKKANYAVTLEFYAEIDPAKSPVHHSARDVELKLQKKNLDAKFWPRLLKDTKKMHFLKTDFDKWVDEDEQDAAADDDYMDKFGGQAPGMGGMGGMGGDGDFGGLDFSKLGGAGGMGGMGGMPDFSSMAGMGGMGGAGGMDDMDDQDDDDEEMPALEDEEGVAKSESSATASETSGTHGATGASATKTSSKIEEVE